MSLYRWRGVSQVRVFVGFDNFSRLFGDPVFWQSLAHNLALLIGAGGIILVLSLAIAHGVRGNSRSARVLRGVYLFPQVTPLVVVAILWMFIFNPSFGIMNATLRNVGLEKLAVPWLGTSGTALPAVGVAFVWHALGFYIMLFSAGLQTIPDEVREAATLDGAHGLALLWRVTLPMLWAVLRVAMIYLVINALNIFALVFLMTQGGPDRHTEVMLTYLYEQAFKNSDFGFATALAVANLVVVLLLSGMVVAAFRRDPQGART